MAALDTVAKCIVQAREYLQDEKDAPYRYSDASLLRALTNAFVEVRKLRPDLMIGVTTPEFIAVDNTAIPLNEMYRLPLIFFMCGTAQLRDDEETQDQRAAAFLSMFQAKLTTVS